MRNPDNPLSNSIITISYLGVSDDSITTQLVQIAESHLRSVDELKGLAKKVPFLIAESFQNVIRHGEQSEKDADKSPNKDFFQIDFFSDKVILSSGNWIERKKVARLDNKIDVINELNEEELKSLWKSAISKEGLSVKGGAGLGIIEMARKSTMPIKKKFVNFDKDMSIFFMGIEIADKTDSIDSNFDISKSEEQYNRFVQEGVLLKYSGHFNTEMNFPLIDILERNFVDSDKLNSDTAENMTMIIEIIQNASKHGMILKGAREGTFSIHGGENQLYLKCNNYVSSKKQDEFKRYLDSIKSMNQAELKAARNKKMLDEALSKKGNGGLGIIEIALFTENKFNFSFQKKTENYYTYSIEIKLKSDG